MYYQLRLTFTSLLNTYIFETIGFAPSLAIVHVLNVFVLPLENYFTTRAFVDGVALTIGSRQSRGEIIISKVSTVLRRGSA